MPPIKTEPGVRIKPEHESRFDFSSIPRPPVSSVSVKQEDRKHPSVPVKQEDRKPFSVPVKQEDCKPDFSLSPYDGQSRKQRRFRHTRNCMVHRLRYGETIRAHYNQAERTVVFTLSDGAASVIDDCPEEWHQAEETIFQRLQKANFNIQSTEPSGFLCREVQRQLSIFQFSQPRVIYTRVQPISGNIDALESIAKQERTNPESRPLVPTVHAKPHPLLALSSASPQPATHITQVTSSAPVPRDPSERIFNITRPKDQSNIFPQPIATETRSSPSLNPSSDFTSGLATGFGNHSTKSSRSIFCNPFSVTELPFPSKSALWSTKSSTGFSLFNPPAGPDLFTPSLAPRPGLFGKPPPPDRPFLAATIEPSLELIVVDSSPESSPATFPEQSLTKKRAAETQAHSD